MNGWYLIEGANHYWVGAENAAAARNLLLKAYPEATPGEPERVPPAVVRFFGLSDGKIFGGPVRERSNLDPMGG
jgi:hypothetical protein